jgi:hypothetical protein
MSFVLRLEVHRDDVLLQSNHPSAFHLLVDAVKKTRWSTKVLEAYKPDKSVVGSDRGMPRKRCATQVYEQSVAQDPQLPTLLIDTPSILSDIHQYMRLIHWCRRTLKPSYHVDEATCKTLATCATDDSGLYPLRTVVFRFSPVITLIRTRIDAEHTDAMEYDCEDERKHTTVEAQPPSSSSSTSPLLLSAGSPVTSLVEPLLKRFRLA